MLLQHAVTRCVVSSDWQQRRSRKAKNYEKKCFKINGRQKHAQLDPQPPCLMEHPSHRCAGVLCCILNERPWRLHLLWQRVTNQQATTDKIPSRKKGEKKPRHQLQQLQAVALGGEEGAAGRGRRTIDQKRHGKERWPDCSAGQKHGKEAAGKAGPPQSGSALCCSWWVPLWPSSAAFTPPLFPRTAACHGSLRWNKMISPHLLVNTGHRGSHAKAGPFVLDRDHWYLGRRRKRRRSHKLSEGSALFGASPRVMKIR